MTYRRGVIYETDNRGRVTVAYSPDWNGKPCLTQFPFEVRIALQKEPLLLDVGDAKKLVAARDHGKHMVVAVLDDLHCARAVRKLVAGEYPESEKQAAVAAFPDYAGDTARKDLVPAIVSPGLAYDAAAPFEPYEDEIEIVPVCHGCGSSWCRCHLPLDPDEPAREEEDEHHM